MVGIVGIPTIRSGFVPIPTIPVPTIPMKNEMGFQKYLGFIFEKCP